jgi:imidazolonepropionase-like amidohydrolase
VDGPDPDTSPWTENEVVRAVDAAEDHEIRVTAHSTTLPGARAGVRIAAGTDFGGGSTRANQMAWEIECLVSAGLQPWEALTAATHTGGELLCEPYVGKLIVGGPADLFLIHGNPLEDPSSLWRVWQVA